MAAPGAMRPSVSVVNVLYSSKKLSGSMLLRIVGSCRADVRVWSSIEPLMTTLPLRFDPRLQFVVWEPLAKLFCNA